MYAVEVSPDLISTVTDAVIDEVTAWQARPLEPMYPVVFFDALRVKIRDEATVRSKAIYLALAVLPDGSRDILGLWIEQTEGAKFWMKVFSDLKVRGCGDILIAVTDGLKGMSEALGRGLSRDDAADLHRPSDSPQSRLCQVERAEADGGRAPDRSTRRPSAEAAGAALDAFERGPWGSVVSDGRGLLGPRLDPRDSVLAFPPELRRVVYTTNALESVHAQLRKIIKTRGHFPTDEAATKLLWLALRNITAKWAARPDSLAGGHESVRDTLRGSVHPAAV